MSIVVDPAQLAETLTQFGHAYLLTTDAAGVVKVNTVEPSVVGDAVVIGGPGMMQARLNVGVHAFATLIWPPVVHHGHTLIVDGTAAFDDASISITPSRAVLHRPAEHADGPAWSDNGTCVQDCRTV